MISDVNGVGDDEANDPCRSDRGTEEEHAVDHLAAVLEFRLKRTSKSACKDHLNENCVLYSSLIMSRGGELMPSPQTVCIGLL